MNDAMTASRRSFTDIGHADKSLPPYGSAQPRWAWPSGAMRLCLGQVTQWLRQALESRLGEMFIEGKRGLNSLANFTPRGDRRGMVLIVRRFQRDQKTGVKKICRHDPSYKCAS